MVNIRQPFPLSWLERRALRRLAARLELIAPDDRQASHQLDAVNVLCFADHDARQVRG